MGKTLWILAFFFALPAGHAQAVWNNTAFVHRQNQQILDGQNQVIKLDGVNLGGWLLWEGWIWGGGFTQEKTIFNNIQNVVGATAANAFRQSVYQQFISRQDIQAISQSCFNVVRIPFNHQLLDEDFVPYVYKPAGWAVLDSVLQWCEDYNVYAVLDLHAAPGGQNPGFISDPDFLINLWNGAINQKRTKRLWKEIANRYKDRGIIAGYDLLNEPDVAADSSMLQMYRDIIDSIRLVDNHHMIFVEGNQYATNFTMFNSLPDPNICFQFHLYSWFFPNMIAEHLQVFTDVSNALNVPIWCGEWGENNLGPLSTTLDLFNDPAYRVSGSAFWNWKKMKTGSAYPYYNGIDTTLAWNKTIRWVSNTNLPQPTAAEMQTGLNEFLHNVRWENCSHNPDLAALLNVCTPTATTLPNEIRTRVFPNPFSNRIRVTGDGQDGEYELLNASGKLVWSGRQVQEQDFSDLPAGLYLLKINSPEATEVVKLIKQ